MSRAPDDLSTGPARTVSPPPRERESRTGQVGQIFIDGGEFLIIHSSERTPWHLPTHLVAVGIDACAHGVDEVRKFPLLDKIEVGAERPELPGHAAGQIVAMAFAAILIGQDVLSERKGRALRRRCDAAVTTGLPLGNMPAPSISRPSRLN